MRRIHMIAAVSMRYGTRRLRAGDEFRAKPDEAKVFKLLKWASGAPVSNKRPLRDLEPRFAPETLTDPEARCEYYTLEMLRARHMTVTGRKADHRWGKARLLAEIAKGIDP